MKDLKCIASDVSKDSSHIQAFSSDLLKLSKVEVIDHTLEGFNEVIRLYELLDHPMVVFEATGVYHRGLQKFLVDSLIPYVIINPLVSAKIRKQSLRSIKTDKKDCRTIAKAYFTADSKDTLVEPIVESHQHQMRQLNRYYVDFMAHLVKAKVSFNAKLDCVFPGLKKVFPDLYSDAVVVLITRYKHPDIIKGKKSDDIAKYLEKNTRHGEGYCKKESNSGIGVFKENVLGL